MTGGGEAVLRTTYTDLSLPTTFTRNADARILPSLPIVRALGGAGSGFGTIPPRDRVNSEADRMRCFRIRAIVVGVKRSPGPDKERAPTMSPVGPKMGAASAAHSGSRSPLECA